MVDVKENLCIEAEWSMLKQIELRELEKFFSAFKMESNFLVGYYANVLMDLKQNIDSEIFCMPEKLYDNIIVTNPKFIKKIFRCENQLCVLRKSIKEKLIFLMPYITKKDEITVFWGNGFCNLEKLDNVYTRWYIGAKNEGNINFYNNTPYIVEIEISGRFISLDKKSTLEVYYSKNNKKSYSMEYEAANFNEVLKLYPGCNNVVINYYGNSIQIEEGRHLRFCIENMEIKIQNELMDKSIIYEKADPYGLMRYGLNDEYIRQVLHEQGFFEVESLAINENGIEIGKKISAFAENWSEYYIKNDRLIEDNDVKVLIYTAKRKGEYYE